MMDRKAIRVVEESKYLSTENTWRYRAIVRYIYKKYEQMKYSVYKEEIFEELKKYEEFSQYNIDNLKSDLDQLVNWKNLNATADTARVNTIEEFKNREFRYNITPVAVEFERLLISLEHMTIENTSTLESSLVEKFRELIEELPNILNYEDKKIYEWFKELNGSFQQLNRNYQDYISKFYSSRNDEIMQTTEFLIYKEGFIKYLREFIKNIQLNAIAIRDTLEQINYEIINNVVEVLYNYESGIQTLDFQIQESEFKELNVGRIMSMMEWFIYVNGREPLVDQLINNTNEIIRKITRYAASIADKKSNNANRKEEYKKIAMLFKDAKDLKEANKISALVFGSFNIIKVCGHSVRETESINSSIYAEEPRNVIINPKIRQYREKTIKNPIKNKKDKKKEKLEKLIEKRQEEKRIIRQYIKDHSIEFKELPVIPESHRRLLLSLVAKGSSKKRQWNSSEMGMDYKLEIDGENSIILRCDDGNLRMPPYKIIFKEEM